VRGQERRKVSLRGKCLFEGKKRRFGEDTSNEVKIPEGPLVLHIVGGKGKGREGRGRGGKKKRKGRGEGEMSS